MIQLRYTIEMADLNLLSKLVTAAYAASSDEFAHWMIENHLPVVAQKAQELSDRFGADGNLAVAGAWLHDFGDAFVDRHADNHDVVSKKEAVVVLQRSGFDELQIEQILTEIIAPHSCHPDNLPMTLEGKVLATADALAHLTTDFYLQFSWMHIPEEKSYSEFKAWAAGKIERDFNQKLFFDQVREEARGRYEALRVVFEKKI